MKYYIFNKPFNVLSQFTSDEGKSNLSDYLKIERDCYPIGRLDYNSEGLLIITNDKKLNFTLLNPENAHKRTYIVQVEGVVKESNLRNLTIGVEISINHKDYFAKCVEAKILNNFTLPDRVPPVRYRANIPSNFLQLILTEGKNHQVRKMTAKIGHPTLRLIRTQIEHITLEGIEPGTYKLLSKNEIYKLLSIKNK
ncbi:MAG TPA: pseudouridine synthase [Candidatus Kapabacteria bacterium]|nr:pseudouridine synthase [Candidatus Kapabacteria bacterium]